MSCTPRTALRRILLLFALVATVTLAACGGGGGSGGIFGAGGDAGTGGTGGTDGTGGTGGTGTPVATSIVTGTAATGAPIVNMPVTLKDSSNRAVTATTSVSGAFTLDSSNLAPPFLLQVTLPSGTRLLSVSTDANVTATINITPLTDLLVRSWYGLQGQSADAAFANTVALPPPTPAQVRALAQALLPNLQLAINANAAPIAAPADLIAKPFAADGTGIDKLLDNTRVTFRSGGADLVLTAGSATQATALAFATATGAITASNTVTNGTVTTSTQATEVLVLQPAQATALDRIQASLAAAANVMNSRGAALTVADLEPFFDANLLHEGRNRAQMLAETVAELRQAQSVSLTVDRVLSLDLAAGKAEIELAMAVSVNGQAMVDSEVNFFVRGSDGQWRFGGDGRLGRVSLQAEGRRNQGLFAGDNGPSINADVRIPQGLVTSVSAGGAGFPGATLLRGSAEVLADGSQLDVFFGNTGPLAGTLPAAGIPVTFTLQQAAGGSVGYTLPLNAFTTELIQVTAPTGTTIRAGAATVAWTLPTTYVVEEIQLSALLFTGDQQQGTGFQCIEEASVAPTATSGTVNVAATCNGEPVRQVNLNVSTNGVNGERSQVVYFLTLVP
jgi:hypothetical protein